MALQPYIWDEVFFQFYLLPQRGHNPLLASGSIIFCYIRSGARMSDQKDQDTRLLARPAAVIALSPKSPRYKATTPPARASNR